MSRPRAGLAFDATLALAAFGLTLALMGKGVDGQAGNTRSLDLLGVVLAALGSLPLLVWRRAPVAVFVVMILASATAMLLGYPGQPPLGATAALYLIATSRSEAHPWSRPVAGLVIALFAVHFTAFVLGHRDRLPLAQIGLGALIWALAWFAGERARLRRNGLAELEQRALRAERDADRDRRLAIAEERTRIARDLHDSAAHAINVIAVQAGAARLLQDSDPGRARQAIETIERVAQSTVREIDHIVKSLREPTTHRSGRIEPQPGLATLQSLIDEQANAGLSVTLTTAGPAHTVAPATDQAAYRILQEALTNSARHGAGQAEVELAFGDEELELTVTNPVGPDVADRVVGGHGLVGMRERAKLLGGRFDAGRVNGSFHVRATLPYGGGG
jgi:signal transduction histidine kinase